MGYQSLKQQCILGFPQYESIPIHPGTLDPNFDFFFSSDGGPVLRTGQTTYI